MDDDELQLEDLMTEYPIMNANFQSLISKMWEFAELTPSITEAIPKRGEYFKHQRLIQRFLRHYDDLFAIHDPGTGKTCMLAAVAEYFRKELERTRHDPVNKSTIQRTIIVVKGPTQVREMKRLLVCICTDGFFETERIAKAPDETSQKKNVTTSLKRWYQIYTYGAFSSKLEAMSDAEIKARFSGSIIFIDEVHNLRTEKTTEEGKQKSKKKAYDQLWRLNHVAERCKHIIASATPMVNKVSEIGAIFNLILPAGVGNQFGPEIDFEKITPEELDPYMRGKISYVRALDTGAVKTFIGQRTIEKYMGKDGQEYDSQMIVYPVEMSDFQTRVYRQASTFAFEEREGKTEKLKLDARQAGNFAFPDGTWGSVKGGGFKKFVTLLPDGAIMSEELRPYVNNLQSLRQLSIKTAVVAQIVMQNRGKIAVMFGEFVEGSGLVVDGLVLEALGFERFSENTSIFSRGGLAVAPYCSNRADSPERKIRADFLPSTQTGKPRYAILTNLTPEKQIPIILEALNSYENRHGDYIQFLLMSGIAKEGININNGQIFFFKEGVWNPATKLQAEDRIFRATSHEDILNEKRAQIIATGGDPSEARINVEVYNLAAIPADLGDGIVTKSVDLQMYQRVEFKDRKIHAMLRMMKQLSIDCWINMDRNVRDTDIDNSATCDYTLCKYDCFSPKPPEGPGGIPVYDYHNYDILYIEEAIERTKSFITAFFQINVKGTIEMIKSAIAPVESPLLENKIRKKYIAMTLGQMIKEKTGIRDQHGYINYLREDNGIFYLSRDYPFQGETNRDRTVSYYSRNIIAFQDQKLNEIAVGMELDKQREKIAQMDILDPTNPEEAARIDAEISGLKVENRAIILENAIIRYISEERNSYVDYIIRKFNRVLIRIREPITEIKKAAQAMAQKGIGPGRPGVGIEQKRTKRINFDTEGAPQLTEETETEFVYVHMLYTQAEEGTGYATMAHAMKAEGRLRLLKPSEKMGWRDTNKYEIVVYNIIMQYHIYRLKQEFEENRVYGIILQNGNFQIRDKSKETAITDGRKINRGRKCTSWKKPRLIDFMWESEGSRPPDVIGEAPTDRHVLLDAILKGGYEHTPDEINKWSTERLSFYYLWNLSGLTKPNICAILRSVMEAKGRILKI